MNDDRLLSALGRLGDQELSQVGDGAIRARLETAWVSRARPSARAPFGLRRLAPLLGAVALTLSFGGAALGAGADSPLWDTRVALEAGGALLRFSADDRVAYLLELVRSRTEEGARQEAAGNPGAAAKAREAAGAAVLQLHGSLPQIGTDLVSPTSSPTPSPAPVAVPAVGPTETPAAPTTPASPAPTAAATATRAPAATTSPVAVTPVPTEPFHSPSPSPTPLPTPTTNTKQTATITGTVRDPSGVPVSEACITTSSTIPTSTTSCITRSTNGSYAFSASITPGQTITLYAFWSSSTGANFVGTTTASATVPTTIMPVINLTPRR
ncbi:MAG: hypothetical protein NVS9B6_13220 [Candidatus Limnocylindrales bacterium]